MKKLDFSKFASMSDEQIYNQAIEEVKKDINNKEGYGYNILYLLDKYKKYIMRIIVEKMPDIKHGEMQEECFSVIRFTLIQYVVKKKIECKSSFKQMLIGIIRGVLKKQINDRNRYVMDEEIESRIDSISENDLSEIYATEDTKEILKKTLRISNSILTEKQKKVLHILVLNMLEDKPHREMSDALDMSLDNFRDHLKEIRKRINENPELNEYKKLFKN
jgi:RNA polymerase sigma factor (sigma-70 family)